MLRYLSALVAVVILLTANSASVAEELWLVESGRTTFFLNENLMKDLGLRAEVQQYRPLPPVDSGMEAPNWTFEIVPASDMNVRINVGSAPPSGVTAGGLRHDGSITIIDESTGYKVRLPGAVVEYLPPEVYTSVRGDEENRLFMRDENEMVVFEMSHSMLRLVGADGLDIYYLNMRMSESWAEKLGRPQLGGLVIGMAEVRGTMRHISGTVNRQPFVPNFGPGFLDVSLGILASLQQAGRSGDSVALTMATTSCNVGDVDVPWDSPMDEEHPVIHMAMYRLLDGRFEQIGLSWMKHGFFALSSSQCTPCQNPSNGSFLGVGCSDTYGPGNNSDRRYLGPRSEINPYLGTWECSDSHFQGSSSDCSRGHGGSGHSALEHRLVVDDDELNLPGAEYFYEGYYVVEGDEDKENNWAYVPTIMALNGDAWIFNDDGPQKDGPAIRRWGEIRTEIPVPGDGKVILAVDTTDLGNGTYHYQYALLNFDSDREIRTFELPVDGVSNVTNFTFHDADGAGSNDWTASVNGGVLSWSTDTFNQDPDANALTFGEMFSFGFDADAAPEDVTATLGLFELPAGESVTGQTRGPQAQNAAPLPPTLSSTSHTLDTWSTESVISAEWTGASDPDGIAGYSIVWDQSPTTLPDETIDTTSSFGDSPALADGTNHWLHVRTVDGFGTWTSDAVHMGPFWIDATLPLNPSANADRPAATWSNIANILASWSGADDQGGSGIAGYSFEWDQLPDTVPDEFLDTASESSLQPVADGQTHYFHLRTLDVAGNVSDPAATVHLGPFWVDSTPPQDPQVFVSDPAAGAWTQDDTIVIQWSDFSDNLSGVDAFSFTFDQNPDTLPDADVDSAPGDSTNVALPDGNNWFHLRTRDVAGNWTSTAHVGPFQVDTTAPVSVFTAPGGGEEWPCFSSQTIGWSESDLSGVQSVEIRLSLDQGQTYPIVVDTPNPGEGTYSWSVPETDESAISRLQIELVDQVGNTTVIESEIFKIVCNKVSVEDGPKLTSYRLENNVPNPFNPRTQIRYGLPQASHVKLTVWNAQGQLVRTLVDGQQAEGWHTVTWNGNDQGGASVASGIYFYRMESEGFSQTRRLVLIK